MYYKIQAQLLTKSYRWARERNTNTCHFLLSRAQIQRQHTARCAHTLHYPTGQKNVVKGCVVKTTTHATFDYIYLANIVHSLLLPDLTHPDRLTHLPSRTFGRARPRNECRGIGIISLTYLSPHWVDEEEEEVKKLRILVSLKMVKLEKFRFGTYGSCRTWNCSLN